MKKYINGNIYSQLQGSNILFVSKENMGIVISCILTTREFFMTGNLIHLTLKLTAIH